MTTRSPDFPARCVGYADEMFAAGAAKLRLARSLVAAGRLHEALDARKDAYDHLAGANYYYSRGYQACGEREARRRKMIARVALVSVHHYAPLTLPGDGEPCDFAFPCNHLLRTGRVAVRRRDVTSVVARKLSEEEAARLVLDDKGECVGTVREAVASLRAEVVRLWRSVLGMNHFAAASRITEVQQILPERRRVFSLKAARVLDASVTRSDWVASLQHGQSR